MPVIVGKHHYTEVSCGLGAADHVGRVSGQRMPWGGSGGADETENVGQVQDMEDCGGANRWGVQDVRGAEKREGRKHLQN